MKYEFTRVPGLTSQKTLHIDHTLHLFFIRGFYFANSLLAFMRLSNSVLSNLGFTFCSLTTIASPKTFSHDNHKLLSKFAVK